MINKGSVQTVLGPVAPEALGLTLPHEHVLVDMTLGRLLGGSADRPDRVGQEGGERSRGGLGSRRRRPGNRGHLAGEVEPAHLPREPGRCGAQLVLLR